MTHLALIAIVVYVSLTIKHRSRAGSTGDTQVLGRLLRDEIGFKFLQREKEIENLVLLLLHRQLLDYCLNGDTGEERRAVILLEQDCGCYLSKACHMTGFVWVFHFGEKD